MGRVPAARILQEQLDASTLANQALDEQLRQSQQRIAELEAAAHVDQLDAANRTIEQLRTEATAAAAQLEESRRRVHELELPANPNTVHPENDIPRPEGHRYSLQAAMRVDRLTYQAIQRAVRDLSKQSGLDWKLDFRHQDVSKLHHIFNLARTQFPVLKRFRNNWATSEILKQYLSNTRKHAYKMGYIPRRSSNRGTDNENANPAT